MINIHLKIKSMRFDDQEIPNDARVILRSFESDCKYGQHFDRVREPIIFLYYNNNVDLEKQHDKTGRLKLVTEDGKSLEADATLVWGGAIDDSPSMARFYLQGEVILA